MRKGEQTRERILLRAAGLFNQKGYFGASLSDVMRVTGLQKGGVYNHFESKEKLALEAFDFALKMITGRFERALSGKRHAAERLLALISVFRAYTTGSPIPGGCPVMNTAIESDDAHPGLQRRARQAMNQWRELLCTIVRKGVERKELHPSADADFVATLFIASLEGAIMLTKLYNDPTHITRVADHLSEYVETTLRA
jgi:TetR/AcrR family transcriptional repressor of nem operon